MLHTNHCVTHRGLDEIVDILQATSSIAKIEIIVIRPKTITWTNADLFHLNSYKHIAV